MQINPQTKFNNVAGSAHLHVGRVIDIGRFKGGLGGTQTLL